MIRVPMVQTSDGAVHINVRTALRHAERRYGDALTALAHQLVRCEKYQAICEYLDTNLGAFAALKALKDDHILVEQEEIEVEDIEEVRLASSLVADIRDHLELEAKLDAESQETGAGYDSHLTENGIDLSDSIGLLKRVYAAIQHGPETT